MDPSFIILLCLYCYNKEVNVTNEQFKTNYSYYLSTCEIILNSNYTGTNSLKYCLVEYNSASKIPPNKPIENLFLKDQTNINTKKINFNENINNNLNTKLKNNDDYQQNDESIQENFNNNLFSINTSNSNKNKSTHSNPLNRQELTQKLSKLLKVDFHYSITILLILIYTLTIILSIVGNILVIIVMCCGFRSSFLDISPYLMNLSIFNLLMSIFCIPFTFINALLGRWIFNAFMCPFTNFIQLLSVNGCIFTLTFLAINRFFAVAYPLKYNSSKNRNHNRKSLCLVWTSSVGLASIQLFIYKCVDIQFLKSNTPNNNYNPINSTKIDSNSNNFKNDIDNSYYVCTEVWDPNQSTSAKYYLAYTIWIFMQTFCIPVVILIIMYSKIISILWNRNCSNNLYLQENVQNHQNEQHEYLKLKTYKTIRMLCVVILLFALNWLPIHVFQLYVSIANYNNFKLEYNKIWISGIFFFCHWLSMANSFINPIIYSFMNKRFKTDLYHLLHCNKSEKSQQNSHFIRDLRLFDQNRSNFNDNDSLYQVAFNNVKKKQQNLNSQLPIYQNASKRNSDRKRYVFTTNNINSKNINKNNTASQLNFHSLNINNKTNIELLSITFLNSRSKSRLSKKSNPKNTNKFNQINF